MRLFLMFAGLSIFGCLCCGSPAVPPLTNEEISSLTADYAAISAEVTIALDLAEKQILARDLSGAATTITDIKSKIERFKSLDDPGVHVTVQRLGTLDSEYGRVATFTTALTTGTSVVSNQQECSTVKSVVDVWQKLKVILPTDHEWSSAKKLTTKLEACRKGIEQDITAVISKMMMEQRKAMPKQMELVFLDNGFDVRVSLRGKAQDEIRLTWVLMSRVTVHQLTNNGSLAEGAFLRNLQDSGFKKVVFADGYNESYSYDLKPDSVASAVAASLSKDGAGQPFILAE